MKGINIAVFAVCISVIMIFGTVAFSFGTEATTGDIASGKPSLYLDPSQEKVIISCDEAQIIVADEFPESDFVSMKGELIEDEVFGKIWQFSASTKDNDHILIGLDANNGDIYFYFGNHKHRTVKEKAISSTDAVAIAQEYLSLKARNANIQLANVYYLPPPADDISGEYLVRYSRLIHDIPCISDGISICINENTGDITTFKQSEVIPADACNNPVPKIQSTDAELLASKFMKTSYETEIDVVSSKLRWIDLAYPSSAKGCHDVRLTWWLEFNDAYLEKNNAPCLGSIWIDADSGEILKKAYFIG